MAEKNNKMTPFQQELVEVARKVLEYKKTAEGNVVGIIYKQPEEICNLNLTPDDFHDEAYKTYYIIAHNIVMGEGKNSLDELTIEFYLDKKDTLRKKYEKFGGYKEIECIRDCVKKETLDGYVAEMYKWAAVIKLCKSGFPVRERLDDYTDMSADEIYTELEAWLNHTFVNIENDIKSYDISDGIDELIDSLDEGNGIGLPYYNMPMLTNETGGQYMGSITLIGGLSNVGKSTFCRTSTIPSIIEKGESIVVMLNEDGLSKWQRELLVFVCNNILKYDIQKYTVRDGNYTDEVKAKLHEAADWIREHTQNHTITIIPFQNYQTSKAIKVIRKYANLGVRYFIIDTFKMDAGKVSENSWLQMQQSMVEINDVVKPEAMNLHILITFQLNKGSVKQRYYTQDNIGMSKSIIDVASTCIMIRDLYKDEYAGESREVKVHRLEGKTPLPVTIDPEKRYQILFIVKNREGAANDHQIVVEHDLSRNIMKEIGIANIMPDSF